MADTDGSDERQGDEESATYADTMTAHALAAVKRLAAILRAKIRGRRAS